jgi:aminoglycoside phosphotransferase (APT) family kinase protein
MRKSMPTDAVTLSGGAGVSTRLVDDLRTVVRRATGDGTVDFAEPPRVLTGGFWARLVSFRLTPQLPDWSGPLVARVMPDAATAAKETVVQRAVGVQGYPTPWVVAAGGPDEGIDGQAYLVMDLAPGAPLLAGLDGIGTVTRLPSLARRLPNTLAGVLARLHRLDPSPVVAGLDVAGVRRPDLPSMLSWLEATAILLGRPDLADAASRLAADPRAHDQRIVICHGDLHPFNVLVAEDSRLTVLDWSTAVLAPAAYDVAFTSLLLAEPPVAVPRALQPVIKRAGNALSRRFLRAYEHLAEPVDRDDLAWYQAIVCLRARVEVAGWVAEGSLDQHRNHPWMVSGRAFASRLADCTGVRIVAL